MPQHNNNNSDKAANERLLLLWRKRLMRFVFFFELRAPMENFPVDGHAWELFPIFEESPTLRQIVRKMA